MKTVYTPEVTVKLVADYEAGVELSVLATDLGVTVPSVRAKLVAEKVYVAKERATVGGASPVRKAHLVRDIALALGTELTLESLEKATKPDLEALLSALTPAVPAESTED